MISNDWTIRGLGEAYLEEAIASNTKDFIQMLWGLNSDVELFGRQVYCGTGVCDLVFRHGRTGTKIMVELKDRHARKKDYAQLEGYTSSTEDSYGILIAESFTPFYLAHYNFTPVIAWVSDSNSIRFRNVGRYGDCMRSILSYDRFDEGSKQRKADRPKSKLLRSRIKKGEHFSSAEISEAMALDIALDMHKVVRGGFRDISILQTKGMGEYALRSEYRHKIESMGAYSR